MLTRSQPAGRASATTPGRRRTPAVLCRRRRAAVDRVAWKPVVTGRVTNNPHMQTCSADAVNLPTMHVARPENLTRTYCLVVVGTPAAGGFGKRTKGGHQHSTLAARRGVGGTDDAAPARLFQRHARTTPTSSAQQGRRGRRAIRSRARGARPGPDDGRARPGQQPQVRRAPAGCGSSIARRPAHAPTAPHLSYPLTRPPGHMLDGEERSATTRGDSTPLHRPLPLPLPPAGPRSRVRRAHALPCWAYSTWRGRGASLSLFFCPHPTRPPATPNNARPVVSRRARAWTDGRRVDSIHPSWSGRPAGPCGCVVHAPSSSSYTGDRFQLGPFRR